MFLSMLLTCFSNCKYDKFKLRGNDYRLFEDTPAWELAKAVKKEDVSKIDLIVSSNPKIIDYQEPMYGQTLLMLTIMNQQYKSFKALLAKGADVNIHDTYNGTSPLIEACNSKYYDLIYAKMLIESGANVNDVEIGERREGNSTRLTPLIAASVAGNINLVQFLVTKNADVNYQNEFGQSALSEAVMVDNYHIAYYLILNGANYQRPIFYRPDYSIPLEKRDSDDKGTPIYLIDCLNEDFSKEDTSQHKYMNMIMDFVKKRVGGTESEAIPESQS